MNLRIALLALSACLLGYGCALADTPAGAKATEEGATDRLEQLDLFINDAMAEGLLVPSGQAQAQQPVPVAKPGLQPETQAPQAATVPAAPVQFACPAENPFDFSSFEDVRQYSDIYPYKDPQREADSEALNVGLVKIYLSLGLHSEAHTLVARRTDAASVAYGQLIHLLEDRAGVPVAYFERLARCQPETEMWLAVALLKAGRGEGVRLLDTHLSKIRKLPYHMRVRLASITVPELQRRKESVLVERILADFDESELQTSRHLSFLVSMVRPAAGVQNVDLAVDALFSQSQFQDDALALVMNNGETFDRTRREVMLEEVRRQFEHADVKADQSATLKFALREMSAEGRYQDILDLMDIPSLQTQEAQTQIEYYFVGMLRSDLASEDDLKRLRALRAFIAEARLISRRTDTREMYHDAARVALDLGFKSLAVDLSQKAGEDEALAVARAEHAYDTGDHEFVYAYSEAYPHNQAIGLLAALSALDSGNESRVRHFEHRISTDEAAVMTLLQEDALSERWIVSDELYLIAASLPDPAVRARVADLQVLRRRARGEAPEEASLTIATIDSKLAEIGESLGALTEEAH